MRRTYLNNIKNGMVMALCGLTMSSCLLDDAKTDFGNGPDFVAFTRASVTAPIESDGSDYNYDAVIKLIGPNRDSFRGEITVSVGVDPQATDAEAGVHYSLPSNSTIVLNSANDYTATYPITIHTEGVEAPIVKNLGLYVNSIDTPSEDIIISDTGKCSAVSISDICFADLRGTYADTNSYCGPGSTGTIPPIATTKNADGGWDLETADGGLLQ